jgi:glycosyltransferase involved in cell wall biosynthesis
VSLVSIVIPSLNYGHFLAEAADSVVAQTHGEIELIVVDYGSSDDTPLVAARYPQALFLQCENRGLGTARNEALQVLTGEFVMFLDADDKLVPDAVATAVACLEARPDCVFAYGHQRFFDESGPVERRGGGPAGCLQEKDAYAWMLRTNSPLRNTGAVLYRQSFLRDAGGFAPDLNGCEDVDLNLRLARMHPICCNDRTVLMTRVHESNMTHQWGNMLAKTITAQRRQRAYVAKHPEYRKDYQAGLSLACSYWGRHLVDETVAELGAGSFRAAVRGLLTLARWHPRGLLAIPRLVVLRAISRLRGRMAARRS